jgi:S1-C subfamily serine protease
MDQLQLLEAVERYLRNEMDEPERNLFEDLRKNNPELDQMVVEHHFFLEQMDRYGEVKRFKANLYDTHHTLQENGDIRDLSPTGQGKIAYLWNRYRRVIAVAASIAGITALVISSLFIIFSPKAPIREIEELRKKVNILEKKTNNQGLEIKDVKNKIQPGTPIKFGGTSFLIDGKGYLITSAHVIQDAVRVFIQNNKGQDFRAEIIYTDKLKDIALLQINDNDFKPVKSLPYGIRHSSTELAEPIFTLGYPKEEIVYGEGYLSAKTGLKGDTMACQISISANPGNSGGPVLNKNGEVIGILNARQTTAEGVVFAIKSQNILRAINEFNKLDSSHPIHLNAGSPLKGMERVQQVKKIEDCVYMVKVVVQ